MWLKIIFGTFALIVFIWAFIFGYSAWTVMWQALWLALFFYYYFKDDSRTSEIGADSALM